MTFFSLSDDETSLKRLANVEERVVSIRVINRCRICQVFVSLLVA